MSEVDVSAEETSLGAGAGMLHRIDRIWTRSLRVLVHGMTALAAFGILGMTLVTTLDVAGRMAGHPLRGAYDIVTLLAGVALGCALPYTTAVKGHVAVEFFFLKLRRRKRRILDGINRVITTGLFLALAWQCAQYGQALQRSGDVSPTLEIPRYPLAYIIALSCFAVALVIAHHLTHPGKELIRP